MSEKKTYVVETSDAAYEFPADEVHDVVHHDSGALVIEGVGPNQAYAFAPGEWTRWYIETSPPGEEPS
jgi:hypothetical protein